MLKGNSIPCVNWHLQKNPESILCFFSAAKSRKAVIYPTHWNLSLKHFKLHVKYCCFLDEIPAFDSLPSDVNCFIIFFLFLKTCFCFIHRNSCLKTSQYCFFSRRLKCEIFVHLYVWKSICVKLYNWALIVIGNWKAKLLVRSCSD